MAFLADAGFVGYSSEVLSNNSYQSYTPGEDFFSVFGVFFPTATGVMAGKYIGAVHFPEMISILI